MAPDKPARPAVHRCGRAAILGRPNVGKSTLLNRILGQKLSITSRRPQTTRWHLLGIKSAADAQVIYVDTPGFIDAGAAPLARHMQREMNMALEGVDVIVLVVEALKWTPADRRVLAALSGARAPVILALNKLDRVKRRADLLPFIKSLASQGDFQAVVPVSARTGDGVDRLETAVRDCLPESPPAWPPDQLTDRNERFLAGEMLREALTRRLGAELPYRLAVSVDRFREGRDLARIDATVWVESAGQKAIVIGREGRMLKAAGEQARASMEALLERKVMLRTWVKVRRKWTGDDRALQQLGYAS